jgi:hypothetical protein
MESRLSRVRFPLYDRSVGFRAEMLKLSLPRSEQNYFPFRHRDEVADQQSRGRVCGEVEGQTYRPEELLGRLHPNGAS